MGQFWTIAHYMPLISHIDLDIMNLMIIIMIIVISIMNNMKMKKNLPVGVLAAGDFGIFSAGENLLSRQTRSPMLKAAELRRAMLSTIKRRIAVVDVADLQRIRPHSDFGSRLLASPVRLRHPAYLSLRVEWSSSCFMRNSIAVCDDTKKIRRWSGSPYLTSHSAILLRDLGCDMHLRGAVLKVPDVSWLELIPLWRAETIAACLPPTPS
mmetsp:Transcript_65907/g.176605  ORF Transcript_65907/g.176605 Transcript_65907/m.176605 type:complete len:210 (+) Transcript_65907:544-1173(+)